MTVDNSRQGILKRFREQIARGEPIIGGGAGTGLSAKSEEAGGIDLLIVYNSGRYRMAGRGSSAGLLAYGNANQIVKEMAYEVLPVVKHTPVLAGVNGTDPFIIPKLFLEELRALGFAGIQNFPTVGLFDGDMRQAFEETGMSYQLEVDIIRLARELDMLTTPYVFNPSEAERMAGAGADLIVAHMGVTTGGSIGAKSSKTLDDCVTRIQDIADAARGVNPDVLVICHGGPISEPPDAEYIITNCRGVDGFYGASSVERLPAERAIADQIRTFKNSRRLRAGVRRASRRGMRDERRRAKKALRFVTSKTARDGARPVGQTLVAVGTGADRDEAADPRARHDAAGHGSPIPLPSDARGDHLHRRRRGGAVGGPEETEAEGRRMRVHPEEGGARDFQLVEEADDLPGDPVAGEGEGAVPDRLLRRRAVAEPARPDTTTLRPGPPGECRQ